VGEPDPVTGYVIDLKYLSDLIKENVVRRFDHRNLNLDTQEFKDKNPTAENIAIAIYNILREKLDSKFDLQIKLYETERNFVNTQPLYKYRKNNSRIMAYSKSETFDADVTTGLMKAYRESIALLGEDPDREGLLKTPERIAKAMQFITQGYQQDACAILNSAKFHEDISEMIVVKDIELYSMCEHHMLPFYGKAHVAYIPNGWITGLSKIARVVDVYSRRLQVQERLTTQILDALKGVSSTNWCGSSDRSVSSMYDDAGSFKTKFSNNHVLPSTVSLRRFQHGMNF
jgi:GTP cyclohydrolase I